MCGLARRMSGLSHLIRELSQGDAASCATQEATNLDGTAFFGPLCLKPLSHTILIIHAAECISGSATCIEDIYNDANRTSRGGGGGGGGGRRVRFA